MERPRDALAEGSEFAGYIIGRVLGRGGFGITYFAVDALHSNVKVAIKEFLPSGLASRDAGADSVRPISSESAADYANALKRFADEARTLVALRHPNVVEALRFIKANGTAYVVMKYEEGQSLGHLLAGRQTLSAEALGRILPPLLDGLELVHARSFIHRDIKPDNIYIRADGSPVLLDFGAARQAVAEDHRTSLTEIVTPGYAPYEQYDRYSKQGPYTDIYALGATLYRCVTGERPLDAPARVPAAARRERDPLPRARSVATGDHSPALLDAIDKALAVFESDRPQTIAEFRALAGFHEAAAAAPDGTINLRAPGASAPPPQPVERTETAQPANRKSRRVPMGFLAGAIAALAVAGGGYFAWSDFRASQRADEARRQEDTVRRLAAAEEARRAADEERRRREGLEASRQAEAERKARDAERETAKPSFDCAKATFAVEKIVCADAALARKDAEAARIYWQVRSQLEPELKRQLDSAQREWIGQVVRPCASRPSPAACLHAVYDERIEKLRAMLTKPTSQ